MSKGRDGTVPRFFVPVPLVPLENHSGQYREILSRSRSSRRLLSRSHGTQKAPGQIVTRVPRVLTYIGLVAGLSRRFFSRSRLLRGFEYTSRSQSRGFAGPGSEQIIGQPPIPDWKYGYLIFVNFSKHASESKNLNEGKSDDLEGPLFTDFTRHRMKIFKKA